MKYEVDSAAITSFRGVYGFLSNFYPAITPFDGIIYPTVEHAYQATKLEPQDRPKVAAAFTAAMAKSMVKIIPHRKDVVWNDIKLQLMLDLLRIKFQSKSHEVALIATGTRQLVEGNYWGDTFWGVCKGEGENHLGRLLMQVRSEINERLGSDSGSGAG